MRIAFLALVLFVGTGGYFLFRGDSSDSSRTPASVDSKSVIDDFKARITQALKNQDAMNYTVERNPNAFACLNSNDGNCEGKTGLIFLFEKREAEGSALSQIHPGHGLAVDTLGCTGFPSKDCPIRIEAVWRPVCSPPRCEFTKSFYLKAKLIEQEAPEVTPVEWSQEQLISPDLKLSAAVACARDNGVYDGLTCRRPGDVPTPPAHNENTRPDESGLNAPAPPREEAPQEAPPVAAQFACPDSITVNGNAVQVDASMGTVKVEIPTSAGCNGQGFDYFSFQCIGKTPATFDGEGQWAQISAVLAPSCGEDQRPREDSPTL